MLADIRYWIKERLRPFGHCISFQLDDRAVRMATIIAGDGATSAPASSGEVAGLLAELREAYGMEWAAAFAECAGPMATGIPAAYRQAVERLETVFFTGFGGVCGDPTPPAWSMAHSGVSEKLLAEAVAAMDRQRALDALGQVFKAADAACPTGHGYKEFLWFALLYACKQNQALLSGDYFAIMNDSAKEALYGSQLREDAMDAAAEILERLIAGCEASRLEQSEQLLLQCRQYMAEHYMEDISRESVAERFHFSPGYFSGLFRKTFGVTFSEQLTELRLENAAGRLTAGRETVGAIALAVGYRDVKYFMRVFKRRYGCTPEEYRRRGGDAP